MISVERRHARDGGAFGQRHGGGDIAEKVGGTEANFAAMMTLKARQLGMTNTIYVNANGLPDNRQLTTARDQAMLARAILRDFPPILLVLQSAAIYLQRSNLRQHQSTCLARCPVSTASRQASPTPPDSIWPLPRSATEIG